MMQNQQNGFILQDIIPVQTNGITFAQQIKLQEIKLKDQEQQMKLQAQQIKLQEIKLKDQEQQIKLSEQRIEEAIFNGLDAQQRIAYMARKFEVQMARNVAQGQIDMNEGNFNVNIVIVSTHSDSVHAFFSPKPYSASPQVL
jgi:uncharacterized protein YjaZ